METRESLLNQDTEMVLEDLENSKRLAVGFVILAIFLLGVVSIYTCTVLTQNKALQSKCASLEVAKKSLEANLLMPQSIKEAE